MSQVQSVRRGRDLLVQQRPLYRRGSGGRGENGCKHDVDQNAARQLHRLTSLFLTSCLPQSEMPVTPIAGSSKRPAFSSCPIVTLVDHVPSGTPMTADRDLQPHSTRASSKNRQHSASAGTPR